jgi:hypothetical protein
MGPRKAGVGERPDVGGELPGRVRELFRDKSREFGQAGRTRLQTVAISLSVPETEARSESRSWKSSRLPVSES